MLRHFRPFAALLTLLGGALFDARAAEAWRPETQEAIALEAARLAPPDLARQIRRHEKSLLAGVRDPLSDSEPLMHMKNADGTGSLDATIAREIAAAVAAIRNHRPFSEVVRRLGRISHFVADANLPLNTANHDREEGRYFRDFLDYGESARGRFAVVFYGVGPEWRSQRDVDDWLARTLARGRKLYPSIREEYRRIGMGTGAVSFDDRSTAFAVAALSYSHAISDVSRALRYIWLASGGGDPRIQLARDREKQLVIDPGGAR